MRKLSFYIIFAVSFLGVSYWGVLKIAKQIGSYLVVNDKFESVDYIVSNRFSPMVLDYIRNGKAKFIVMAIAEEPDGVWRAYYDRGADARIRKEAHKLGIPQEKVLIYKKTLKEVWDRAIFYKYILTQLKAKSALFIAKFYHTRTLRFFLNKNFEEVGIKTYVQHENQIDEEDYDRWWKKTTYANLFLEEYLTMGFYYLNKTLWTRNFY